MACAAGPDISENGLVLALDAANNKSYSRNRFLCPGIVGEGAAADNNVSFALNGTGTFVRMGYGQTVGGYTIKPTDVVYKYVMGGTGCFYHGNKITVPQGSYLNFSFDYLVTGATTYPITNYLANIEDYSGGGLGNGSTAPNSTQGIWQRIVMYSGPATTTVADCNVLLYPGACNNPTAGLADSGTIYYRNPRAEIINYDPDPNSRGSDSGFSYATDINLVNDISGNSNNGAFTNTGNAPLYSSANGGSWIFDGVNDYVSAPNTSLIHRTSNWSYSCWVNFNGTPGAGTIFENGSWTNCLLIRFETNVITIYSMSSFWGSFSLSPTLGMWYKLDFIRNGNNIYFYLNGSYSQSISFTADIQPSSNLFIGMSQHSAGQCFNGRISQASIYNRALSAAEVTQNFNATRGRFNI